MGDSVVISTDDELFGLAQTLLDAAFAYKSATMKRPNISGAVQWLDASDGFTVILTRGEYRERLMMNIDRLPGTVSATFAHQITDQQKEADFGSRTPDGLTG